MNALLESQITTRLTLQDIVSIKHSVPHTEKNLHSNSVSETCSLCLTGVNLLHYNIDQCKDRKLLLPSNYHLPIGSRDKQWAHIGFYQFQLSSRNQIAQTDQSAAYSSSMNHLFCDRLSVIVQSEQFGRSQWGTGNRRSFICYCLINAINISCNKWTHRPLILCYTFSACGADGNVATSVIWWHWSD